MLDHQTESTERRRGEGVRGSERADVGDVDPLVAYSWGGAVRAASILALQRTAGNAAVGGSLARTRVSNGGATVDGGDKMEDGFRLVPGMIGYARAEPKHGAASRLLRQSTAPAGSQSKGDDPQAGKELQTRADVVSTSFQSASSDLESAIKDSVDATDSAKTVLTAACDRYDSANRKAQTVLDAAKATLDLEDKAVETIIEVVAGTTIGLGVGAIVEGLELATIAAKAAAEAIGEGVKLSVSWGLGPSEEKHEQSADALRDPGGATPTEMKLEVWQKLADAYRSAATTSGFGSAAADARHWADVVSGEAAVYAGGGKGQRSIADIEAAVLALEKMAASQKELPAAIAKLKADTASLQAAAKAQAAPDETRMEQQIWIEWMAGLPRETSHKLLDVGAVEDHLLELGVISGDGKSGLLAVDFGWWTSQSDTDEAVEEAAGERAATYRDTFGPQQVGKSAPIAVILGDGGPDTGYWVSIPGTRWSWPILISRPDSDKETLVPLAAGTSVQITGYNAGDKMLTGVTAG